MYGDVRKAWKSPGWTPKVSFHQRQSLSGQGGVVGDGARETKESHEAGTPTEEGTVEKREHANGLQA